MNQKLINELNIDLENMLIIVNEVEQLLMDLNSQAPTNVQKTALAAFASQFYTGAENIIKRIHKHNNIVLPKGDDWHIQLLKRCSIDFDFDFPLKLNKELYSHLNELRRFRHYFFHGYSINIDWDVLNESISDLRFIYTNLEDSISSMTD